MLDRLRLGEADAIATHALRAVAARSLKRVVICVLDPGGQAIVVKRQDVIISEGRMAPAVGGLRVARDGTVVGAVGVSGETPDNDEALAMEGIGAAGLAWGESAS